MIDQAAIDRLRAETDIVALVSRSVKLTRRGKDWWGICPFHKEDSPSFKVSNERGTFKCFGCSAGGDAFEWVQQTQHCTFPEAVERLSNGHAAPFTATQQRARAAPAKEKAEPTPIVPVPADAPPPPAEHPSGLSPTATWPYRNAAGELVGYVYRFDQDGKRKRFSPLIYTAGGWEWAGLPNPRPLYRLPEMLAAPNAPVLLVEGEGKCDRIQALLPDYACVAWHGGAQAVKQTEWLPLVGRHTVLWPDNDDVGRIAMGQIVKILGHGRVIEPPAGKSKGWDCGDAVAEGWTTEQVRALLASEPPPEPVGARGPMPEPPPSAPTEADVEPPVFDPADIAGTWPFSLLGHRNGAYFYLPNSGGTVITLSGGAHTKSNLMMLAPLNFWEMSFGIRDNKGWDAVANALLQGQHRKGIFDPTALRGRGAWWDDGKVVVHLGDRLLVGGAPVPIREFKTEYVYEVGPKLRHAQTRALSNAEAAKFIDLCKMMAWERSLSAYLLAGWCVLAPICGALKWRPHIFLSGAAGSGKTWLTSKVVTPALGPFALSLAASITEPGVRRALGFDARPVLVDEFEAKDELAQKRIEQVMGLMRYSSSETDAMIVKGSNSSAGVEFFKIRSMFCTAAIGSLISDYADRTRISVLGLRHMAGKAGADRFAEIELAQREVLTEKWIDGLHARTVSMIDVIRANCDTFAIAGAGVFGTRRLGDQLGTLLAGAFALTSRQRISAEAAEEWLRAQDWTEEKEIISDTDGPNCFARIMEHKLMCEARQGGRVERTIGELLGYIAAKHGDEVVAFPIAQETCRRHGIKLCDGDMVAVSNSHSAIRQILYDSPWAANWHARLKTIKGAESSKLTMSFGSSTSKAVLVPRSAGAD